MLAKHGGLSKAAWDATQKERQQRNLELSRAALQSERARNGRLRRLVRATVRHVRKETGIWIRSFCRTVNQIERLQKSRHKMTRQDYLRIRSDRAVRRCSCAEGLFVLRTQRKIRKETERYVLSFIRRVTKPYRKQQKRKALQEMQDRKRLQQWHTLYMGYCLWCGKPFVSAESRRRYCSTVCEKAFKHHRGHTKDTWLETHHLEEISLHRYRGACQWCEEIFETENPNQRNCKPLCGKYLFKAGGLSRRQWRAEVVVRQEAVREARRQLKEALRAEKELRRQQREAARIQRELDHRVEMARRAEARLEARIQRELDHRVEMARRAEARLEARIQRELDRRQAQALRAEARQQLLEERRMLKAAVKEADRRRREAEREQRRAKKEEERLQRREAAMAKVVERRAAFLLSRGVDLAKFELGRLTEKESAEYKAYCDAREAEWQERLKLREERRVANSVETRYAFLEAHGVSVENLQDLTVPGTEAYRAYKREKTREYHAKNRERLTRYHRLYYVEHRDEIRERQRYYYLAHREWINEGRRQTSYEDFMARLAEKKAHEEALSQEAENKLSATRIRFAEVEQVLLLPEEERYEFAKDWTDEERAYAASVLGTQGFGSSFVLTEREMSLDAGSFDPILDD